MAVTSHSLTALSTATFDHVVLNPSGSSTTLDHLVLTPSNATVNPGVAQPFKAEGFDASNQDLGNFTSATTFTIAGGSCSGASCSSSVAGDHVVTGTDGTASGTATLHITGVLGVSSASTYHPVTPTRLLDTRNGTGGLTGPFGSHVPVTFTVTGSTVPAGATAVTGNLTVTGQTSLGYLFIGPVATVDPGSSTLNFPAGDDRANAVTVALGTAGTLSITFVAPASGPTAQFVFDVTGYFVMAG